MSLPTLRFARGELIALQRRCGRYRTAHGTRGAIAETGLGCQLSRGDAAEEGGAVKKVLKAASMMQVGALLGVLFGWQFMAIDACLDGGGAWESRGDYCVGIGLRP